MTESKKKEPQGLFDRLYAASEEVKKAFRKPVARRTLARTLRSAHDNALTQEQDAEDRITKEREKLTDMDINVIIEQNAVVERAYKAQKVIKNEYLIQFGKEVVISDDT